jgi:uncharacterized OB-fold protein
VITYRLCPTCLRATPQQANELFCPIDGTRMRSRCPRCGSAIHTPYARHCATCGSDLTASDLAAPGHPPQKERYR